MSVWAWTISQPSGTVFTILELIDCNGGLPWIWRVMIRSTMAEVLALDLRGTGAHSLVIKLERKCEVNASAVSNTANTRVRVGKDWTKRRG